MTTEPVSLPIGIAVPFARGEGDAKVITAVEQVNGGDTLITVATVNIYRSGDLSRFTSASAIRLTAAEREHLIRLLSDHRFADLAAELGGDAEVAS